jgi:hypothetical protein
MLNRLNSLEAYLDEVGQKDSSNAVGSLLKICEANSLSLFDISNPQLKAWDDLLLKMYRPSSLVFEIKEVGKALSVPASKLSASLEKLNVPKDVAKKEELIQTLASIKLEKKFDEIVKSADWKSMLLKGDSTKIKPKFFGRAVPVAGALITIGAATKNITEAIGNAKVIMNELPLEKYNLSLTKIFSPAAVAIGSILSDQIEQNKDNPENLSELLDVCRVISAFYMDFIFALSNSVMMVIDILTALSALLDGPLPIADVLAGLVGFVLSMGIIGAELGSEYLSEKYWKNHFAKIKSIAIENIQRIEKSFSTAEDAQLEPAS